MKYKKIKPRRTKFKDHKILYIFLLFLFIGVGYASLTTSLSINGTTNVATNSWNIHFANLHVQGGSVESTAPTVSTNSISYAATLAQPGDYYEFSVDIKNDGTLPGKVSLVNLTGNNTNYLSTSYAYSNGDAISVGDIINAGKSRRVTIKAWIPSDIDTSLLPSQDTSIALTFNLQHIQSEVDAPTDATDQLIALAENNDCMYKYEGNVTDKVGVTEEATQVYFNKCADRRNIIFGGFCWQMIRTTETGGIKMLYNGEPEEGKCLNTRGDHKGIVQSSIYSTAIYFADSFLVGDSFTYDENDNTFTIHNTQTAIKNDSSSMELQGKFTCNSMNSICDTLYQINGKTTSYYAQGNKYEISTTNYAQIGTSSYNAEYLSPANIGYMFGEYYSNSSKNPGNNSYKYGTSFDYNTSTNEYTLTGTIFNTTNWASDYSSINNTHYTCWNDTGICEEISYIYNVDNNSAYYVKILDGKSIEDVVGLMLLNDDINKYNSSIKGIIDNWYAKKLSDKTQFLEDAVYCNARNITSLGGWDSNSGNISSINANLNYKNNITTTNLTCLNEINQFALSNNKAKLKYPVALLEVEEIRNINNNSLFVTTDTWWTLSPFSYDNSSNQITVRDDSVITYSRTEIGYGIRPVISLAPGNIIASGTGSESDPWIVQE